MKVAGFTFIRNAITNDYPVVEAITSILPLCDEFIIAHGNSTDDTLKLLQSINSPKIKIIETGIANKLANKIMDIKGIIKIDRSPTKKDFIGTNVAI